LKEPRGKRGRLETAISAKVQESKREEKRSTKERFPNRKGSARRGNKFGKFYFRGEEKKKTPFQGFPRGDGPAPLRPLDLLRSVIVGERQWTKKEELL